MENIFESVDKKLKKLREVGAEKPSLTNTSDEKMLSALVDKLPTLIARLQNIDTPIELDGLFKIIVAKLGLKNANKQTVILALRKALEDLEPNEPTITTKKDNNTKQPTSSPTKINESFKRMQELVGFGVKF
jgi:hypothetical protein